MKIRIRGNTIRYRLTMTEVDTFSREGFYEECTPFGKDVFRYALKAVKGISNLNAQYSEGTITLQVPEADAREWAGNNKVGFNHQLEFPNGDQLSLLLEKDFACLDETGEDQSDNFPNPRALS